tara:strand:- start:2310 stop:2744 length:435 start_codon:yes stop_codon:yes gene_type:complete
MRKFKIAVLVAVFSVVPLLGLGMACGAIDGKGYRCSSTIDERLSEQDVESFFYFQDKEVYRAYLAVTQDVTEVMTENLGPYSFTPEGMAWAGIYELDKESLTLSVGANVPATLSCVLMASPLVEILAHFEPILAAANDSKDSSE